MAYVERDARLRIAADPFDTARPATGLKYTWAYDAVQAGEAIAAAGGGSRRTIAVMDTGARRQPPGVRRPIARRFDTATRGHDVTDFVGHGTFVTGLIAAIDGNGIGGKGVAGNTKVLAVRASRDKRGRFILSDLLRGIEYAIRARRRHPQHEPRRRREPRPPRSRARWRSRSSTTCCRWPPRATTATAATRPSSRRPCSAGTRGAPGIGLSVGATMPNGQRRRLLDPQPLREHRGTGRDGRLPLGVFSTLPAYTGTAWDLPTRLHVPVADIGGRRATPTARARASRRRSSSGSRRWPGRSSPRLASEQVAEVLIRSADQHGTGWNQYTGAGVVDGSAPWRWRASTT